MNLFHVSCSVTVYVYVIKRSQKRHRWDWMQAKIWCHPSRVFLCPYFCNSGFFFSVSHMILIHVLIQKTICASGLLTLPPSKDNDCNSLPTWLLNTCMPMCENDYTNYTNLLKLQFLTFFFFLWVNMIWIFLILTHLFP